MDIQLKDLLISIFFEGALSFLWIGVLVLAWHRTAEFVENPLKAVGNGTACLWRKAKEAVLIDGSGSSNEGPKSVSFLYLIIPIIIVLYPVGTIMHRVSDDFIETTSRWMPKPAKAKYCIPYDPYDFCDENLENSVLPICGYKPFCHDGHIKKKVMERYHHLLEEDYKLVKSNNNLEDKYKKIGS